MKAVQHFSDDHLQSSRELDADQVLRFLEDFRRLHGSRPARSKLISIKVPEDLLGAFKARAAMLGVPYQTQIKKLMKAWLMGP
jgi:predicted DNA binding CopG/RHH family protein